MFKLVVLSFVVVGAYGIKHLGSSSDGDLLGYSSRSGYLSKSDNSYGKSDNNNNNSGGTVSAAIKSKRTSETVNVESSREPTKTQEIVVEPVEQPVRVTFKSISSPVYVKQVHIPGAPGQTEKTESEDEPHRVVHEVLRPVIQEVREVIQPYRRIVQEIKPVLEEVHTKVAKKSDSSDSSDRYESSGRSEGYGKSESNGRSEGYGKSESNGRSEGYGKSDNNGDEYGKGDEIVLLSGGKGEYKKGAKKA